MNAKTKNKDSVVSAISILFAWGLLIFVALMLLIDTQYILTGRASEINIYKDVPCYQNDTPNPDQVRNINVRIPNKVLTSWASCDWSPNRAFYVMDGDNKGWVLERDLIIARNPYPFTNESNNNRDAMSIKKLFKTFFR